MQLGKSLVGAILGGAIGIGVLVLIHALTGWDKYWLAIPVALFTGLGVRWLVTTKDHPSYVRGVLTGVIAILAFLAGQYVVAEVTTRISKAKPIVGQPARGRAAIANAPADQTTLALDARLEEVAGRDDGPGLGAAAARQPRAQQWSALDAISLCVAVLIGYALGRGSERTAPAANAAGSADDSAAAMSNAAMPPAD